MIPGERERRCPECGEAWFDSPEFWPRSRTGRPIPRCRACERERRNRQARDRRAANPEDARRRDREAYWRNVESHRARARRAYRRKHPETRPKLL